MQFHSQDGRARRCDTADYGWAIAEANRQRARAFDDLLYRPIGRGVRRLFSAIAGNFRRAGTIRELQSLSDRMLQDIGLSRSDIRAVASRLAADDRATANREQPLRHAVEAQVRLTGRCEAANDDRDACEDTTARRAS